MKVEGFRIFWDQPAPERIAASRWLRIAVVRTPHGGDINPENLLDILPDGKPEHTLDGHSLETIQVTVSYIATDGTEGKRGTVTIKVADLDASPPPPPAVADVEGIGFESLGVREVNG